MTKRLIILLMALLPFMMEAQTRLFYEDLEDGDTTTGLWSGNNNYATYLSVATDYAIDSCYGLQCDYNVSNGMSGNLYYDNGSGMDSASLSAF